MNTLHSPARRAALGAGLGALLAPMALLPWLGLWGAIAAVGVAYLLGSLLPIARASSPCGGRSTLITRAPRLASWSVQNGPASTRGMSSTVTPATASRTRAAMSCEERGRGERERFR